jgi:hypothetical protein
VVRQSPQFAADVRRIAFVRGRTDGGVAEALDASALNGELRAQAEGATVLDLHVVLCRGRLCRYRDGGVSLFADYRHISTDGARLVVTRALGPAAAAAPSPRPHGTRAEPYRDQSTRASACAAASSSTKTPGT